MLALDRKLYARAAILKSRDARAAHVVALSLALQQKQARVKDIYGIDTSTMQSLHETLADVRRVQRTAQAKDTKSIILN